MTSVVRDVTYQLRIKIRALNHFSFLFSEIPNGWIWRSPNALWFGHENVVLRSKWTHQFGRSPASSIFWFGSTAPQTWYTSIILDRSLVGFGKLYLQILPSTKTNKQKSMIFLHTVHYGRDLQDFVQKSYHLFWIRTRWFHNQPFFSFLPTRYMYVIIFIALKSIIEK